MSDNQQNLSHVLSNTPDGSVGDLYIKDTIDLVGPHQRLDVLTKFCAKVRYNGSIELEGVDALEVSRAFYQNYLTLPELNSLLYNDGTQASYRASTSTLEEMCELLRQQNFQVVNQRRNKYIYYIKAVRKLS